MSGQEFKCTVARVDVAHNHRAGERRFIEFECRCSLTKIVCAYCYGLFSCYPDCKLYWIDRTKRSGRNVCDCIHSEGNWCHACLVCVVEESTSPQEKCLRSKNRRYCHFFCRTCQRIHRNYCPMSNFAAFINYK